MAQKTAEEIAIEVSISVKQSDKKQKKLKSSTFWNLFNVKARHPNIVKKINELLTNQDLKIDVNSGAEFGKERKRDWIILNLSIDKKTKPPVVNDIKVEWPSPEWFQTMQTRDFESESEVVTFFIAPLLDKLGYDFNDIVIGFPVRMQKGVKKSVAEADVVAFMGPDHQNNKDILLLVEAKKAGRMITPDHIAQVRSYAKELFPACYIITNGHDLRVFQFNGNLAPDECVMDISEPKLAETWESIYLCTSKNVTIRRKKWFNDIINNKNGFTLE